MAQTVLAKPVAIRLAQRYPNGCMLTYSARALAHGQTFVRVLVNQEFEPGIQLSVIAPFLEGMTMGRVYSVKRSEKQPGFFEMVLRIGEDAVSAVLVNSNVEADGSGTRAGRTGSNPPGENGAAGQAAPVKPSSNVPDTAGDAAEKLAYELSRIPSRALSKALSEVPHKLRPMSLAVVIAAAIHLLQQKGYVVARHLLDNAKVHSTQGVADATHFKGVRDNERDTRRPA
jgi:hypothetical protein